MNVVDSSAWLEYFTGGKQARVFEQAIENTKLLIVPTISLYEVFKKFLIEYGKDESLKVVAYMKQGNVIDLDMTLALDAAKIGKEYKLAMADSIILATAKNHNATLWTMDADFKGISGVKYFPKK